MMKLLLLTLVACVAVQAVPFSDKRIESLAQNAGETIREGTEQRLKQLRDACNALRDAAYSIANAAKEAGTSLFNIVAIPVGNGINFVNKTMQSNKESAADTELENLVTAK